MGTILMFVGIIIMIIGGIMFLIEAFKENILWGLGCLLFNPVSLVFLILHWDVAHKPFFIELAGAGIMILGIILIPDLEAAIIV